MAYAALCIMQAFRTFKHLTVQNKARWATRDRRFVAARWRPLNKMRRNCRILPEEHRTVQVLASPRPSCWAINSGLQSLYEGPRQLRCYLLPWLQTRIMLQSHLLREGSAGRDCNCNLALGHLRFAALVATTSIFPVGGVNKLYISKI